MVTKVRQRITRDLLGRRGTVADPVWVNRRGGGAVGADDPRTSS
jgi:hypothetical protein